MTATNIVADFCEAASLAGVKISPSEILVQEIPAPHRPPSALPKGMLAVYVFMFGDRCLKVGKAGPKSAARFCYQHYGVNRAPSTLAASLVKAKFASNGHVVTADTVAEWICAYTSRINFLLPARYGVTVLSLLEAFVQCRLDPEFEGFSSQRSLQDRRKDESETTHAEQERKHQRCPICATSVEPNSRYPCYVCQKCAAKATSADGRLLSFHNEGFSGGYVAHYADTGGDYPSHECFIEGVKCHADEARFGGIVIEAVG